MIDVLVGRVIHWPHSDPVRVLSIDHEYDDGATCVYVAGPYTGSQTMRDTYTVRRLAAEATAQRPLAVRRAAEVFVETIAKYADEPWPAELAVSLADELADASLDVLSDANKGFGAVDGGQE